MSDCYLLFDIGGTKSRLAVSYDLISFSEPVIFETPQDFDRGIELISGEAKKLCGEHVSMAVGGLAGPLNREKTQLFRAPNLPGWNRKPFSEMLSIKLGCPVHVENDTAVVGLGEATAGPGKDFGIVVYITISTGVNGVRIVNKKIDIAKHGFEIGHQIIDFDNSQNIGSSGLGTLEDFVSGRETEKRYGVRPKDVAEPGIWEKYAVWAAYGVYNTILHWSPEIVIFGGAMMNDIQVPQIEKHLNALLKDVYPETPKMVKAELGSVGGLWGALHYTKSVVR
jgi:predicted NBD/HSP70 family sugar kinase